MKKVSIIIPVYNSEKYLRECIDSIIAQTYSELEIILVNDGSSDSSISIIEEYAAVDPRIKYKSIKNSGVSVARNTGIEMAEADSIVFVDSDDTIEHSMVESLVIQDSADFVMCGYEVNDTKNNRKYKYVCPTFQGEITEFCNHIIDFLIPPFLLGPCFKLFKKEIITKGNVKFPVDISYGEDAEFVLSYLEHVNTVRCIGNVGYSYRQHDTESLSRRFRKDKMNIYKRINSHIIELVKNIGAEESIPSIYERYIQNFVEYAHELFATKMALKEKKELFFSSGVNNQVLDALVYAKQQSIAQKLILFSLKHRVFLPIYMIFTMRDRLVNRVGRMK